MGGGDGGSDSRSSSKNVTNQTTENKDARVAATGQAVAFGTETFKNAGDVALTLQQIPQEVATVVLSSLDLARAAGRKAFEVSDANLEREQLKNQNTQKILLFALGGIALIVLIGKGGK